MFSTTPLPDSCLTLALYRGRQIPIYDDWGKHVYVYGQEYGPMLVIRAHSWESAYYIAIDESSTIPVEEIPEAYGFNSQAEIDAAIADNPEFCPDLIEGYQYQDNATGTGIVNVGHHEWLFQLENWNSSSDSKITPIFTPE